MALLVLGVLRRLRAAWVALVVLQCGNMAVLSGRGEWLLEAGNLVLLVLLVARPTRNYVLHREDSGEAQ